MPKSEALLSLAELERLLADRQEQVRQLMARRGRLQAKLDELDKQLQDAIRLDQPVQRSRTGRRQRPQNDIPLRELIPQILGKAKSGLTLAELTENVLSTGYKTTSGNFKNIVYQSI